MKSLQGHGLCHSVRSQEFLPSFVRPAPPSSRHSIHCRNMVFELKVDGANHIFSHTAYHIKYIQIRKKQQLSSHIPIDFHELSCFSQWWRSSRQIADTPIWRFPIHRGTKIIQIRAFLVLKLMVLGMPHLKKHQNINTLPILLYTSSYSWWCL